MRFKRNVALCAALCLACAVPVGAMQQRIEPVAVLEIFLEAMQGYAVSDPIPFLRWVVAEYTSQIRLRRAVCAFFGGSPAQRRLATAKGVEGIPAEHSYDVLDLRGEMERREATGEGLFRMPEDEDLLHVWHVTAIVSPRSGGWPRRYELTVDASGETGVITKAMLDETFDPVEYLEGPLRMEVRLGIEEFLKGLFDGDGAAVRKRLPPGDYPFDGDDVMSFWVESTGMHKNPNPSPRRVTCVVRGDVSRRVGQGQETSPESLTVVLARQGRAWQVVSCRRDEQYARERAEAARKRAEFWAAAPNLEAPIRRFLEADEAARRAMLPRDADIEFPMKVEIAPNGVAFGRMVKNDDERWAVICGVASKEAAFKGGAKADSFHFWLELRGGRWTIVSIFPALHPW